MGRSPIFVVKNQHGIRINKLFFTGKTIGSFQYSFDKKVRGIKDKKDDTGDSYGRTEQITYRLFYF